MNGLLSQQRINAGRLQNLHTMRRKTPPNYEMLGGVLGQFDDSYDYYFDGGGYGGSDTYFFDDQGNVVDIYGDIIYTAEDFGYTDTGSGDPSSTGMWMDSFGNVYDETGAMIYTGADLGFSDYTNLDPSQITIPTDLDTTTGLYYDEAQSIAALYGANYNPSNGLLDFGGVTGFIDANGNLVLYGPDGTPAMVMDPVTGKYFDPSTGGFTDSGGKIPRQYTYTAGTRVPGAAGSGFPGGGSGGSSGGKPTPQQQQQMARQQAALRQVPLQQAGLLSSTAGGLSMNTLLIAGATILSAVLLSRGKK